MGDELKPCPFCGGEAELWHNAHWDYVVRCTKCGAKTRQHHENGADAAMDWDKREGYRIVGNAFQSAVSKWAHADAENRELRELIVCMYQTINGMKLKAANGDWLPCTNSCPYWASGDCADLPDDECWYEVRMRELGIEVSNE